jgi:hypothetical protein
MWKKTKVFSKSSPLLNTHFWWFRGVLLQNSTPGAHTKPTTKRSHPSAAREPRSCKQKETREKEKKSKLE